MSEPQTDDLEALERQLADLRAKNDKRAAARRAIDMRAVLPLFEQYGPDNLRLVEVGYISDELPVLCVVRANDRPEFKRYRSALERNPDGTVRDAVVATDQLGRSCTLYPDQETLGKLCDAKVTLSGQLGREALSLSRGESEAEKKG